MRTVAIPKRSGGTRTVCLPSPELKRELRQSIPRLQQICRKLCDGSVIHGFAELRSPVTNAQRHVGYRYTLSLDLKDFFDSVTQERHGKVLRDANFTGAPIYHEGVARQGLPTSPIVANIAAAEMDKAIVNFCGLLDQRIVYTRYADDLTFSFNDVNHSKVIEQNVTGIARAHGFTVNAKKTTLQDSRAGRRIITGVAVDDTGLHPTRAAKRKLRAARHNLKHCTAKDFPRRQWTKHTKGCRHRGEQHLPKQRWLKRWLLSRVRGLEEWLKLKPPVVGRRSALRIGAAMNATDALHELAERQKHLTDNTRS